MEKCICGLLSCLFCFTSGFVYFFFFKQKTAYEIGVRLGGLGMDHGDMEALGFQLRDYYEEVE